MKSLTKFMRPAFMLAGLVLAVCTVKGLAAAEAVVAADGVVEAEIRPFIKPDQRVLEIVSGDLNGDGLSDRLIVLESIASEPGPRTLLILTRQPQGGFNLAAHNDRLVLRADEGGVMGDPFVGASTVGRGFRIDHHGGSAWRWSHSVQFAYSKKAATWLLKSIESESFHTGDPEATSELAKSSSKDFGEIRVSDFDFIRHLRGDSAEPELSR